VPQKVWKGVPIFLCMIKCRVFVVGFRNGEELLRGLPCWSRRSATVLGLPQLILGGFRRDGPVRINKRGNMVLLPACLVAVRFPGGKEKRGGPVRNKEHNQRFFLHALSHLFSWEQRKERWPCSK